MSQRKPFTTMSYNQMLVGTTRVASTATTTIGAGFALQALLTVGAAGGALAVSPILPIVLVGIVAAGKLGNAIYWSQLTSRVVLEDEDHHNPRLSNQEACSGLGLGVVAVAATSSTVTTGVATALGIAAGSIVSPALAVIFLGLAANAFWDAWNDHQRGKAILPPAAEEPRQDDVRLVEGQQGGQHADRRTPSVLPQSGVVEKPSLQDDKYTASLETKASILKGFGYLAVVVGASAAVATLGPAFIAGGAAVVAATHLWKGGHRLFDTVQHTHKSLTNAISPVEVRPAF